MVGHVKTVKSGTATVSIIDGWSRIGRGTENIFKDQENEAN